MITINIKDFSKEAATETKGKFLKGLLETPLIENNEISVDFNEITRFASPFFNNSFSALALKYGFDKIEHIHLINLSEVGQLAYKTSIDNAKFLSENPKYSETINNIINTNLPKKDI